MFFYTAVLFFLLSPKVVFEFPGKFSRYIIVAIHAFLFSVLFSILQWCIIERQSWTDEGYTNSGLCDLPQTSDAYRAMLKYIPSTLDFQTMKTYLEKSPPIRDILLSAPEFKKIEENGGLSNEEKIAETVKLINQKLDERDSNCPPKT